MVGRLLAWALALVLTPIGLYLAYGGLSLASMGGSWYYVCAGVATLATAALIVMRKQQAVFVYAGLLVVTLIWSVWEVGLDGWALAPRLIGPAVLGLWLLAPPVRKFVGGNAWWIGAPVLATVLVFGAAAMSAQLAKPDLPAAAVLATDTADQAEWRAWGRTQGGGRYAPIAQITAANVDQLELAWRYDSPVEPMPLGHRFQGAPLLVNDHLFACLERNVVVALEPETGREVWRADPQLNAEGLMFTTCRGVAYAEAPQASDCATRILWGTADMRLLAVDAETGRACESFGARGVVDLTIGMGALEPMDAMVTSPPTIVNGVAVVGAFINDGMPPPSAPGVVRGYDVATGALRWAWEGDKPESVGEPPAGQTYARNTPNAWSIFSADDALGLVFLPMGNVPPDTYGARRTPGADRYSSSIVALDAASGNVRWSFQTVHHDLWDWDVPTQPVAVDLPSANGTLPALIAATKRGQLFVLDRRTGAPIDAVEERPVPQGALGEDHTAPTQPYTTGFPSMAGERLREVDMWGLTPLDQMWCRTEFRRARYEGEFTPPSAPASIQYPGSPGGNGWGGVSVDPGHGVVIATSLHVADYHRIVPAEQLDSVPRARAGAERIGAPFAIMRATFMSPLFTPCQRPPYGRIHAFDLNTRALLWSRPLGTAASAGPFGVASGLPILMGAPNTTGVGSITTAGGLIFTAAGGDRRFRAYDIGNGREVWSVVLPEMGTSTPMTYVSRSGRQFVLVTATEQGGGGRPPSGPRRNAPMLLAYALPQAAD